MQPINTIPINTPLIDSFKLRIPLKLCKVLDKRLLSETCIYYLDESLADNEKFQDEVLPPKPYDIYVNGITFRFSLCTIPIHDKKLGEKVSTQFIEVVLTSKLLGENYFSGINADNIAYLYDQFISHQIIETSFKTFINSQVSDIDICKNYYSNTFEAYRDTLRVIMDMSGSRIKYLNYFEDEAKCGLQFNTRRGATPSLPFGKIYNKELELQSKSAEFYNTYLHGKGYNIKNLFRSEWTIKNARHITRLKNKSQILPDPFRTLSDLLELDTHNLNKFISYSLDSYITTTPRVKAEGLSPTDHMIFICMQELISKGHTKESIISMLATYENPTEKTQMNGNTNIKKRINKLFDLLLFTTPKLRAQTKYNEHIKELVKAIGIDPNAPTLSPFK